MLTLLESPATSKRSQKGSSSNKTRRDHRNFTSTLKFNNHRSNDDNDDALLLKNYEGNCCRTKPLTSYERENRDNAGIYRFLTTTNAGDCSEKWRKDFSRRPSWCDASIALSHVWNSKATGNTWALTLRSFMQKLLFWLGRCIQIHPQVFLFFGALLFGVCCFGLKNVEIQTDIVKLWVSKGGRLDEELNFLSRVSRSSQIEQLTAVDGGTTSAPKTELPKESGLGGGFQVVIQVPSVTNENILNKNDLLKHVEIMKEIANYRVEMHGENWTLADICFKPPAPAMDSGPLSNLVSSIINKIIPCIWITPIDCFWEGSKPLGPFPPIPVSADMATFIESLPVGNVTWKNLDPTAILKEVSEIFDLGTIPSLFERAGVGKAYLDRYCIEPLDPECPESSPNYFNSCAAVELFILWNKTLTDSESIHLVAESIEDDDEDSTGDLLADILGKRRRRQVPVEEPSLVDYYNIYDDEENYYDDNYDDKNTTAENDSDKEYKKNCRMYKKSLLEWMPLNEDKWTKFLNETLLPEYPDYGKIMTGGCHGFAKNIMAWPEDLIIGGIRRNQGKIVSAEALQSVFLVAGGNDVFFRFRTPQDGVKMQLDTESWNPGKAGQIVNTWQRTFTKNLYNHQWNTAEGNLRQVHPLASTSIADMLEEFSQFKFFIIFIGYFFMLLYAGVSLLKLRNCRPDVDSCAGLGFAGVLLVTLASVAGLGMSTWFGIEFNAATTQIVPFLTLGLGVDDMFLLVHNYQEIVHIVDKHQIGFLMKETGLSVMLTSINNIMAFASGSLLPIPALRSFCAQTAILLFFNVLAIITMYPAIMAMDISRRKRGHWDILCCFGRKKDESDNVEKSVQKHETEKTATINGTQFLHKSTVSIGSPQPPRYEELENSADSTSTDSKSSDRSPCSLKYFLHKWYIPMLQKPVVKAFVVVFCLILLAVGIGGLSQTTLGLELSDVLPSGTPPAAFLEAREKYFSFYPMHAVIKGADVDYPTKQHQIRAYRNHIGESPFVIKVKNEPSEEYWLSLMTTWLSAIQKHYDEALMDGQFDNITGEILSKNMEKEAKIGRMLICSYGNEFNCTGRIGHVRLVDDSQTINTEGFYNYLTAWYNIDNMMYYVSQASFFPAPPSWGLSDEDKVIPPAKRLAYSQIPLYLTDLVDTPATMQAIRDIRSRCDDFTAHGLPNFPTGIPFTFWEQYLHLTNNLLKAIAVITFAVFVVISGLLLNPWTGAMVVGVVLMMVIELAGFMGWVGLKLNPVSAVTLITAVGIGVEFTVHVCLSFLTSLGSRNDRMAMTLDHMFVPVVHGGLSTLLGIIMLAFSEFDFIIRYFFMVMTALIVIGLINGLALLPVLLSLIGPPCEVGTVDGSDRLLFPMQSRRISDSSHGDSQPEDGTITVTNTFRAEFNQRDFVQHVGSLSTINEDSEQQQKLPPVLEVKTELNFNNCRVSNLISDESPPQFII